MAIKSSVAYPFFLLIIALFAFYVYLSLNAPKKFSIETEIRDFENLRALDEYIESYLRSQTRELAEYSTYLKLYEGFGVVYWDSFPKCGFEPPTFQEVESSIVSDMIDKIGKLKEFIRYLSRYEVIGQYSIFIDHSNVKIDILATESDVMRGKYDEYIPMYTSDLKFLLKSPYGDLGKTYSYPINLTNNRALYLYRVSKQWIDEGGFQKIIEKYKDEIFKCSYGVYTNVEGCNKCLLEKLGLIEGKSCTLYCEVAGEKYECKIKIYKCKGKLVEKTEGGSKKYVCEEECEEDGERTYEYCKPKEEVCEDKFSTSITTPNLDVYNIVKASYIAGGRGGRSEVGGGSSPSSGSGGSSGGPYIPPCPESFNRYSNPECEPKGEECVAHSYTKTRDINVCQGGAACPSYAPCHDIDTSLFYKIAEEIENELNSRYDDYVICTAKVEDIDIKETSQTTTHQSLCSCSVAGKTDTRIIAIIAVSCTDRKYKYFFPDARVDYNTLNYKLRIAGWVECPMPSPDTDDYCCDCDYVWECVKTVCEEDEEGETVCRQVEETVTTEENSPPSGYDSCSLKDIICDATGKCTSSGTNYCEESGGTIYCI